MKLISGWLGWLTLLLIALYPLVLEAQPGPSADELFRQAHDEAFKNKDYPGAILKCRAALLLAPGDPDIRVFLGRVFAWSHQSDSARRAFEEVLALHPGYEDACIAYADLASWNDSTALALSVCAAGLQMHPHSEPLLERRRALLIRLRDLAAANKVGIAYDYVYFDRQFKDPWHLLSVDYSRQTKMGTVIGRVNYANRFRTNGVQFEAEAYPHISRIFYAYLNFGYSSANSIFPQYRAGGSLYANLPHAFEADAGLRWLYFGSDTWLYTFALGKYYKNFWFNARTYLVPGNEGLSQSVTLTGRYYFGGADDYLSLGLGTGISPDDRSNNQQLAYGRNLRTLKTEGGWRHALGKFNIVYANIQWLYQEYLPKVYGNQVDIGIGYQHRF